MAPHRYPILAFVPALNLAAFGRVLVPHGGGARGGGAHALPTSQSSPIPRLVVTSPSASTGPPTPIVDDDAAAPAVATPTPTPTLSVPATHMVTYRGRRIPVAHGTILRTALIRAGASPHNGRSTIICCRGLGTCGTCAVAVVTDHADDGSSDGVHVGAVAAAAGTTITNTTTTPTAAAALASSGLSPPLPSARERARLAFPPHTAAASAARGLRLACQVRVVGDVTLAKGDGFWGHRPARLPPLPTEAAKGE